MDEFPLPPPPPAAALSGDLTATVVEIDVSSRCEHECFSISCASEGIWRFDGLPPIEAPAEAWFVIHHCDNEACGEGGCWTEEVDDIS